MTNCVFFAIATQSECCFGRARISVSFWFWLGQVGGGIINELC